MSFKTQRLLLSSFLLLSVSLPANAQSFGDILGRVIEPVVAQVKKGAKPLSAKPLSTKSNHREDKLNLTRYVKFNQVVYRDAPNGNKLEEFRYATKLTVYERIGKWVRVSRANESDKWVRENYLSSSKPTRGRVSTNQGNSNGHLKLGVTNMSMSACRNSVYAAARARGVNTKVLVNTSIGFIARVPLRNSNSYDFVTCSKPDGHRSVERFKL